MSMRPAPFGIFATNQGSFILNRNDVCMQGPDKAIGVGFQLMTRSEFDPNEIDLAVELLRARLQTHGEGVVAVDCGANLGVHTVQWAQFLGRKGEVYAFEAQEKIYYALAGNVIVNNCFNVHAKHGAVSNVVGKMSIPEPDYVRAASFGSFELRKSEKTEFIGQVIDYDHPTLEISTYTVDSLNLKRLDLLKIDVEGMELEVLEGAAESIKAYKPHIYVEILKCDAEKVRAFVQALGYTRLYHFGLNLLCIHKDDPVKLVQQEATEEVPTT